jgi:cytochrome c-type biogenesis protein CcmH/NrfG
MIARAAAVVLILVAATVPEIRRYRAERLLWRMHAAADLLGSDPAHSPDSRGVVEWIDRSAGEAAAALPGDGRPWLLEGEARLDVRDFPGALAALRRASAAGERADVDFEMGRAFVLSRDFRKGQDALVRAAWISPAVLSPLPDAAREALEREIARLAGELRQGRLKSPPPRPE